VAFFVGEFGCQVIPHQILRQFQFPEDLLPGSLSLTHRRCGKPTCHCASGEGHPIWLLGFMCAA